MTTPVIITVAITGALPRKKDNPAVPVMPAEQIESTHEAFEAGASLVHIHVRNPDESPSSDPALYGAVQEGVRKHCPGMIVQFSTGGRGRATRGARNPCIRILTSDRTRVLYGAGATAVAAGADPVTQGPLSPRARSADRLIRVSPITWCRRRHRLSG